MSRLVQSGIACEHVGQDPHVGYETAARIAREAIVTGKPVRELILRDKLLTRDQLDEILDPFEMTSPGIAGRKAPQQEHVWMEGNEDDP